MAIFAFPSPALPDDDSGNIKRLRMMVDSDDVRFLIGDIFMRIAASEPAENIQPYTELMTRLLGKHQVRCENTLKIMMSKLDYLRAYDMAVQHRKNMRQMLKETNHGRDVPEKSGL